MKNAVVCGLLICGAILAAVSGRGQNIYVSLDGANNDSFASWEDAATNIQWAVDAAASGETVWISNGVYALTNEIAVSANIDIVGYTNNGAVIIDGNHAVRCFNFKARTNGLLANLVITRGTNNAYGGGVYSSNAVVRDCVFSNNHALYGAGMYFSSSGAIQRCTFVENVCGSGGGGLYVSGGTGDLLIDGCVFRSNSVTANHGGGLYTYNCGKMVVTGCNFTGNRATRDGSAASINIGAVSFTKGIITDCAFVTNVADRNGALYCAGPYLVNACDFSNNIGKLTAGYGGALYIASGGTAMNCRVANNFTKYGGGIHVAAATVKNCVIRNNYAAQYGGGLNLVDGVVEGCLVVNNKA